MKHGRVVVVGSVNQDLILRITTEPDPGRTVLVESMTSHAGGKGANQAVAAARLGADATLVACVGDDPEGDRLLRALRQENVDITEIELLVGTPSGMAVVMVRPDGENSIMVVPGANALLSAAQAAAYVTRTVRQGDVVVLQAEVPREVVVKVLQATAATGARPVLNLAPYLPFDDEVLALADPLVVNESEASALLGDPVHGASGAAAAAGRLSQLARSVVVTAGAEGACWAEGDRRGHIPAVLAGRVVDTTGSGDAFVGALAADLAMGRPLSHATRLGVRAGSFAVRRLGAQTSYPTTAELAEEAAG